MLFFEEYLSSKIKQVADKLIFQKVHPFRLTVIIFGHGNNIVPTFYAKADIAISLFRFLSQPTIFTSNK